MAYFTNMREFENILTLVESIDEQRKDEIKDSVAGSALSNNDPFGIDDLDNTVSLGDEAGVEGPSFSEDDIDLSEEDKAIVRQNLQNMIDELSGESISEPALEMIIQEVAQKSVYLNESEEDSVETPVEKNSLLKTKIKAAENYSKQLLGLAAENDGVIPEEEPTAEPTGDVESDPAAELDTDTETPEEGAEEPVDGTDEPEPTELTEGEFPLADDESGKEEDADPIDEGVCAECGEVVDVPESDVIKVVDDSEVEPLDDLGGEEIVEPIGGEGETIESLSAKFDDLKSLIEKALGKSEAVFEAAGLFGEYNNKSVEGGNPVINTGAQHSDFQAKKTATLATKGPAGFKLAELRKLDGSPKKVEPTTPKGKENKANIEKNAPTFAKGKNDVGKSQTEPDSGYNGSWKANAPKKPSAQPAVATNVKAAVVRESVEGSSKSFLEEARRIIRQGK
jgi:hypothetical protein